MEINLLEIDFGCLTMQLSHLESDHKARNSGDRPWAVSLYLLETSLGCLVKDIGHLEIDYGVQLSRDRSWGVQL